jgi:hypothetical protein
MSDSIFETCKTKLKVWAGAIGANGDAEDMKAAAIVAQKRIDYALKFGSFLQDNKNSNGYQKLVEASEHLGKIVEYFEKGEKLYKDFKAVQQIFEAIQILKDDQIMFKDSAAAAKAFDQLFIGFGTLAKHFPPPFDSTIGELLIQCGTLSFFSNMRETMVGNKSNLGRAMYLRDNMD